MNSRVLPALLLAPLLSAGAGCTLQEVTTLPPGELTGGEGEGEGEAGAGQGDAGQGGGAEGEGGDEGGGEGGDEGAAQGGAGAGGVEGGGAPDAGIGPAGGVVRSDDGRLELEVPALALTRPVTIEVLTDSEPPPGAIGAAYRVEPDGTVFAKPVRLILHAQQGDPDASAALRHAVATGQGGVWSAVADGRFDGELTAWTGVVGHLSNFALVPVPVLWPSATPSAAVDPVLVDSGPGCWSAAADTEAVVGFTRQGTATGELTVSVQARQATALAGVQFDPAPLDVETLRWEDGVVGSHSVRLALPANDGLVARYLLLLAEAQSGGAVTPIAPIRIELCAHADPGGVVEIEHEAYTLRPGDEPPVVQLVIAGAAAGAGRSVVLALEGDWPSDAPDRIEVELPDDGAPASVSLPALADDGLALGDVEAQLRLTDPVGVALGPVSSSRVTLEDPQADGGLVGFASPVLHALESAGSAVLTVTRQGRAQGAATARVSASDLHAKLGEDYEAVDVEIGWEDGETGGRSVAVHLIDDQLLEADETLAVNVAVQGAGAAAWGGADAVVSIIDDGAHGGILQFVGEPVPSAEEPGLYELSVGRTGATYGTASVQWSPLGGSAVLGQDYDWQAGVLSWPPGDATPRIIRFRVLPGPDDGPARHVGVELHHPAGGAVLGGARVTTITAHVGPPVVEFSASGFQAEEGRRSAILKLRRTGAAAGPLTVAVTSYPGTASQVGVDADYTALSGAAVRFVAGETEARISVSIHDDDLLEGSEDFTVVLATPPAPYLAGARSAALVDIADDDAGAAITGVVFADSNGDGAQGRFELGVVDARVRLHVGADCAGPAVGQALVTDAAGGFAFPRQNPGIYSVRAESVPGAAGVPRVPTLPAQGCAAADASDGAAHVDLGFADPAQVTVTIWDDQDGDGAQDDGEPGIDQVTVTLRADSADGVVVASQRTGVDGAATFAGLLPRTLHASIDPADARLGGRIATHAAPEPFRLREGASQTVRQGFATPWIVSGVVFADWDRDGVRGDHEPGFPDIELTLTRAAAGVVSHALSILSDPDGAYVFEGLPPVPAGGALTLDFAAPDDLGGTPTTALPIDLAGRGPAPTQAVGIDPDAIPCPQFDVGEQTVDQAIRIVDGALVAGESLRSSTCGAGAGDGDAAGPGPEVTVGFSFAAPGLYRVTADSVLQQAFSPILTIHQDSCAGAITGCADADGGRSAELIVRALDEDVPTRFTAVIDSDEADAAGDYELLLRPFPTCSPLAPVDRGGGAATWSGTLGTGRWPPDLSADCGGADWPSAVIDFQADCAQTYLLQATSTAATPVLFIQADHPQCDGEVLASALPEHNAAPGSACAVGESPPDLEGAPAVATVQVTLAESEQLQIVIKATADPTDTTFDLTAAPAQPCPPPPPPP